MMTVAPTTAIDPALATLLDDPRLAGAALAFVDGRTGSGADRHRPQYLAVSGAPRALHAVAGVVDVGIVAARRCDKEIRDGGARRAWPGGRGCSLRVFEAASSH